MLEQVFVDLLNRYASDEKYIAQLWSEINKHYSNKHRHYHNLSHLDHLLQQLIEVKNDVADWDTILFSLYYHDIIYKPLSKDNEENSAKFAVKILRSISYPAAQTLKCEHQILSTKTHVKDADNDTNLLLDADLSILGEPKPIYECYCKNVRREYAIVPELLYKRGRVKVLQQFLAMESIFKTMHFINKYEEQARKNIAFEIEMLSS